MHSLKKGFQNLKINKFTKLFLNFTAGEWGGRRFSLFFGVDLNINPSYTPSRMKQLNGQLRLNL